VKIARAVYSGCRTQQAACVFEAWNQISEMPTTIARKALIAAVIVIAGGLAAVPVPACDNDADCGPGATCIKREKRAGGVCYGGRADAEAPVEAAVIPGVPAPVEGELRERATHWLGDPEALIRENLPDSELGGTCMVTQDCPAGFDCVVAGFEGRCVKQ
jgi:hypothetical protein